MKDLFLWRAGLIQQQQSCHQQFRLPLAHTEARLCYNGDVFGDMILKCVE